MTDHRPQYGEIATVEEQRRAAGLPPLDEVDPPHAGAQPAPTQAASDAPVAPRASNPVDRFVTIGLLAYGLVNVVMTAASYLDFSAAMDQVMSILGIDGEFTNYAQGRLWGTVAAIVLVVGWALTAYLSVRRLHRGRVSWWVPLVGAVATMFLTSIFVSIPMMGDPAFVDFLMSSTGPQ